MVEEIHVGSVVLIATRDGAEQVQAFDTETAQFHFMVLQSADGFVTHH